MLKVRGIHSEVSLGIFHKLVWRKHMIVQILSCEVKEAAFRLPIGQKSAFLQQKESVFYMRKRAGHRTKYHFFKNDSA
jgi:hypothetical protein